MWDTHSRCLCTFSRQLIVIWVSYSVSSIIWGWAAQAKDTKNDKLLKSSYSEVLLNRSKYKNLLKVKSILGKGPLGAQQYTAGFWISLKVLLIRSDQKWTSERSCWGIFLYRSREAEWFHSQSWEEESLVSWVDARWNSGEQACIRAGLGLVFCSICCIYIFYLGIAFFQVRIGDDLIRVGSGV